MAPGRRLAPGTSTPSHRLLVFEKPTEYARRLRDHAAQESLAVRSGCAACVTDDAVVAQPFIVAAPGPGCAAIKDQVLNGTVVGRLPSRPGQSHADTVRRKCQHDRGLVVAAVHIRPGCCCALGTGKIKRVNDARV